MAHRLGRLPGKPFPTALVLQQVVDVERHRRGTPQAGIHAAPALGHVVVVAIEAGVVAVEWTNFQPRLGPVVDAQQIHRVIRAEVQADLDGIEINRPGAVLRRPLQDDAARPVDHVLPSGTQADPAVQQVRHIQVELIDDDFVGPVPGRGGVGLEVMAEFVRHATVQRDSLPGGRSPETRPDAEIAVLATPRHPRRIGDDRDVVEGLKPQTEVAASFENL